MSEQQEEQNTGQQQQNTTQQEEQQQNNGDDSIPLDDGDPNFEDATSDEEDDDTNEKDCHDNNGNNNAQATSASGECEEGSTVTELGCAHYRRNCKLEAPCCKQFFSCRLCHNEQGVAGEIKCLQEFDRYAVQRVECLKCKHVQSVGRNTCDACGVQFARYFCAICNLYDDRLLHIYHCDKCGMCRRGKREHYVHCDTCAFCVNVDAKDHKCMEKTLHQNCPVCLEFMFTSTKPVVPMKCGHWIHSHCLGQMIKSKMYTCPLCSKSIVDLDNRAMDDVIAHSPMPEQFANTTVKVMCNECLVKSDVKWHVFGMKCPSCGSYNTKQV